MNVHQAETRHHTENRPLLAEQRDRSLCLDPLICREPELLFVFTVLELDVRDCFDLRREEPRASLWLWPQRDEVSTHAHDLCAMLVELDVASKRVGLPR